MSVFTDIYNNEPERVIWESRNKDFFVIYDGFPVTPGHALIITSREDCKDFRDLSPNELNHLNVVIEDVIAIVENEFEGVEGFNIGMNCGEAAGQTVPHFHCHVIPRYKGDMEDPKGGVRGVIPEKQKY